MFCQKCGKEIEEDSVFCQYCGASIGTGAPASSGKPQIVIELNKEKINIGQPFIATVKFLKDGAPIEPSEKKITLKKHDGSVVDFTQSFLKIDAGVYRVNTTTQRPMGLRVLDVFATIDGTNVSGSKQYNVLAEKGTQYLIVVALGMWWFTGIMWGVPVLWLIIGVGVLGVILYSLFPTSFPTSKNKKPKKK